MALSAAWDRRVEREARKPSDSARGPTSGSAGGCRRSRSRTARGREKGAGQALVGSKAIELS
jgi:hypothetical protein